MSDLPTVRTAAITVACCNIRTLPNRNMRPPLDANEQTMAQSCGIVGYPTQRFSRRRLPWSVTDAEPALLDAFAVRR
jgi:hypothetical protein